MSLIIDAGPMKNKGTGLYCGLIRVPLLRTLLLGRLLFLSNPRLSLVRRMSTALPHTHHKQKATPRLSGIRFMLDPCSTSPRAHNDGQFKEEVSRVIGAEGKYLRIIAAGKMLNPDDSLVKDFGLTENCYVHCVVTAAPPRLQLPSLTPEQAREEVRLFRTREQRSPSPFLHAVYAVKFHPRGKFASVILLCTWYVLRADNRRYAPVAQR